MATKKQKLHAIITNLQVWEVLTGEPGNTDEVTIPAVLRALNGLMRDGRAAVRWDAEWKRNVFRLVNGDVDHG